MLKVSVTTICCGVLTVIDHLTLALGLEPVKGNNVNIE